MPIWQVGLGVSSKVSSILLRTVGGPDLDRTSVLPREAALNPTDQRRKHFHVLIGKRLTRFDTYQSLLHRTRTGQASAVVGF